MNQASASAFKMLGVYFGASFLLHLLWENAQMSLFDAGESSRWQTFRMCLWATASGDMLFMLALYLTVALIHKSLWWATDRAAFSHPATWVLPTLVGVLLAVNFELWAVHIAHRWSYGSMPLVPYLHVGVTPILQMIVVPLTATALCRWLVTRSKAAPERRI
jgi:phosphate starvation-inducible membrane PsiE